MERKKARAAKLAARAQFDKLGRLNEMQDAGGAAAAAASKAKRKMNDTWNKRSSRNVDGLFNARNAKPGAVVITKGMQA